MELGIKSRELQRVASTNDHGAANSETLFLVAGWLCAGRDRTLTEGIRLPSFGQDRSQQNYERARVGLPLCREVLPPLLEMVWFFCWLYVYSYSFSLLLARAMIILKADAESRM